MSSQKTFKFGLKKSKIDPSEKRLSFCYDHKIQLPSLFSLRQHVPKIYDQLATNSCSANAGANFIIMSDDQHVINCKEISRMYLYFVTRWLENNKKMPILDEGATLKTLFDSLVFYHWISEDKYNFNIEKVNSIPPSEVFNEAIKNKNPVVNYRRIIANKYSIKYVLAILKRPILMGIMVFTNFYNLSKENDILYVPSKTDDECLGGHAVVGIGYDEESDTLEILNSHGSDFADAGCFRLKFEYVLNPDLAFEFYIANAD